MEVAIDNQSIKVLMVCSAWPSEKRPDLVPFLVDQVHSLQKNGIDIDIFAFYGKGNPLRYAWYWLKIHYKFLFSRYDIIHAQFGQSGIVVLPTRTPLIVTFHGSDLQGWIGNNGKYSSSGKVMQKVSRYVAQNANEVIVVSEHLTKYLPPGIPFSLIPCGIDLKLFQSIPQEKAREKLDLPFEKYLVLFVGDPNNPIKQYSLAQQAIELIKDTLDVLMIVATGIPHNVMPLFMNACDVLIVTSKHEGSPTIIKEAMACNLPIVSTDVGDARERIGHLQNCELCSSNDPQTIANAVRKVLLHSSNFYSRNFVKELELDVISQRIIQVYQRVLDNNKRRPFI